MNLEYWKLTLLLILSMFLCTYSAQSQTFIKRIGNSLENEGANLVMESGDGNLIVAGYRGIDAVLIKMSPEGNIIWQKQVKVTDSDHMDIISDIERDGNFLMICGYGSALNGSKDNAFLFRFDMSTQSVIWSKIGDNYFKSRWFGISPYPTQNGMNWICNGFLHTSTTLTEGNLQSFDANGNITTIDFQYASGPTFSTPSPDDFIIGETDGTHLHIAGRKMVNYTAGLCSSRAMMTSLNLNTGDMDWSKYYFVSNTENKRMYAQDMDIQLTGAGLVLAGIGGNSSLCSTTLYNSYVATTDLEGDVIKNTIISIPSATSTVVREIKPFGSGYLILGEINSGSDRDYFMMKLDGDLNVIWTRTYGGSNEDGFIANTNNQFLITTDAIYFVGRSLSHNAVGSWDMVIHKTDHSGFISNQCSVQETAKYDSYKKIETPFSWLKPNYNFSHPLRPYIEEDIFSCSELVCGSVYPSADFIKTSGGGIQNEEEMEEYLVNLAMNVPEEVSSKQILNIFPNPATNRVYIHLNEAIYTSLELIDIHGRVIHTATLQGLQYEMDVSLYPKGIYFINLNGENQERHHSRLVIK